MRTSTSISLALGALVLGFAAWTGGLPGATAADDAEAAVKAQMAAFVKAWNAHDAKAMAAVWAEDGDLVNPWGRLASGRAAVEKLFADEHGEKGPMKNSKFQVTSQTVRSASPDIAVSDAELTITDIATPGDDAAAPHSAEFHLTTVQKKVGGTWLIYAARPYLKPAAPHATPTK